MSESPAEPQSPPVEPLAPPAAAESESADGDVSQAEPESTHPADEAASRDEVDMDDELHRLSRHRRKSPKVESEEPDGGEGSDEDVKPARERRRPARQLRESSGDDQAANEASAANGGRPTSRRRGARSVTSSDAAQYADEPDSGVVGRPTAPKTTKRRKKLTGDDLEAMQDDTIAQLRDKMRDAALHDAESVEQSQPAINKVRMLPEVVNILQRSSLAGSILEGNLLESVRLWLEPLPDASLPSFEIQKAMFEALVRLPIKTMHLRESGLGRVVLFYQKSKRPQPAIKRMAQKLIGDWTRPIIGRSDNYHDMRVATADFDFDAFAQTASAAGIGRGGGPKSSYEESAERRGRAAIPSASGVSYRVAPQSLSAGSGSGSGGSAGYNLGEASESGGAAAAAARDSQLRRLKTKLLTQGRAGRKKSQVSVEGRGLN